VRVKYARLLVNQADNRHTILGSTMLGCCGKVQKANGVIHLIVEAMSDPTPLLKQVSGHDAPFPLTAGRGDEAKHGGSSADSWEPKAPIQKPRDMYVSDLHIDTLKLKARNFK
jgi:error-prone DNA polymerase